MTHTLSSLETKWQRRLNEWRALGISVNGEKIAAEVVADLQSAAKSDDEQLLTPTQAAAVTNFHPESIARMVRKGHVPNHGTKHRPRVKLSDLPMKRAKSKARVAKHERSAPSSAVVGSIDSLTRDALAGQLGKGA